MRHKNVINASGSDTDRSPRISGTVFWFLRKTRLRVRPERARRERKARRAREKVEEVEQVEEQAEPVEEGAEAQGFGLRMMGAISGTGA